MFSIMAFKIGSKDDKITRKNCLGYSPLTVKNGPVWKFQIFDPSGPPKPKIGPPRPRWGRGTQKRALIILVHSNNDHWWQKINFGKGNFLCLFHLIWPLCYICKGTKMPNFPYGGRGQVIGGPRTKPAAARRVTHRFLLHCAQLLSTPL